MRIQLDSFEGPLDLLLHLCKRDEIDILELPISHITSQYLEALDIMQELDVEVGAEFVVMASTLCFLKSRSLLPDEPDEVDEDDDSDIQTREELIRQLLEHKKYRDAALRLSSRNLLDWDTFVRSPPAQEDRPEGHLEGSLFHLMDALRAMLDRQRITVTEVHITGEPISLRDSILTAWEKMRGNERLVFSDFFERSSNRIEILTTFLAILELIRLGAMSVHQDAHLNEISLVRTWDMEQQVPDLSSVVLADEIEVANDAQEDLPLQESQEIETAQTSKEPEETPVDPEVAND